MFSISPGQQKHPAKYHLQSENPEQNVVRNEEYEDEYEDEDEGSF